jgi:uncharacterized protein YlxP (DUF503 family)
MIDMKSIKDLLNKTNISTEIDNQDLKKLSRLAIAKVLDDTDFAINYNLNNLIEQGSDKTIYGKLQNAWADFLRVANMPK